MDAVTLMTLPLDKRHEIMRRQAEAMAPLYEADLALPEEERELTAFMTLNDPFLEPSEYLRATIDDVP